MTAHYLSKKFKGVLSATTILAGMALVFPRQADAIQIGSFITYYRLNEDSIDRYGRGLESISVFAYDFDGQNNLVPASPLWVDPLAASLKSSAPAGRQTFITLVNDEEEDFPHRKRGDLVYQIISDPVKRAVHVNQIVAIAQNVDGVDIDYEAMPPQARPFFTQFIKDLRAAFPAGKKITVDAEPKADDVVGSNGRAIDWKGIAPSVDAIKIMAYYFFGSTSPGAAVAQSNLNDMVQFAFTNQGLSADKLHVVLSLFGEDWPTGGNGALLDFGDAMSLAQLHGATPFRDAGSGVMRVNYNDRYGTAHQIWIDDAQSVESNVAFLGQLGVKHVDFWHLGAGDPSLWTWVASQSADQSVSPSVLNLSPAAKAAGSPAFLLTIKGQNFTAGSTVRWNGSNRSTTFVSPSQLESTLSAGDVASAQNAFVTVMNPNGNFSVGKGFSVYSADASPTLTQVIPGTTPAPRQTFFLRLEGNQFLPGCVAQWNGQNRSTLFINNQRLAIFISFQDAAKAGTASLTVTNPGGQRSNAVSFVITGGDLPPSITTVGPSSATAGGSPFTLTVRGSNFGNTATILWNGSPRATTFIDDTKLSASISASDIATSASIPISVLDLGETSNTTLFNVTPPSSPLTLTSVSPSTVTAGSSALTLTLIGTGFTNQSVARLDGTALVTKYLNASSLTAGITAPMLATPQIHQVTVLDGGNTSAVVPFTVEADSPSITSLSPSSTTAGGAAFTLKVTGSNFLPGSTVFWNGTPRATIVIDANLVSANISSSDIAGAGTTFISVSNPAPSGGFSESLAFGIATEGKNPVPSLLSVSPSSATAGDPGFVLTITGFNFIPSSVASWNGLARSTTFLSDKIVAAVISNQDLASSGTVSITVTNPGPGGGTSAAETFSIGARPTGGGTNPLPPALSALNPGLVTAGDPAFVLVVTGGNYVSGSQIRWGSSRRSTNFLSPTQLSASIAASDVAADGVVPVSVINPDNIFSGGINFVIAPFPQPPHFLNLQAVERLDATFQVAAEPSADNYVWTIIRKGASGNGTSFAAGAPDLFSASSRVNTLSLGTLAGLTAGNYTVEVRSQNKAGKLSTPARADINLVASTLDSLRVFPNPWRADRPVDAITFDGLTPNSTVKLFTLAGHWVKTLTTAGGTAPWDLKDDAGDKIPSGPYLYLITDAQGQKRTGQVVIVR